MLTFLHAMVMAVIELVHVTGGESQSLEESPDQRPVAVDMQRRVDA